MLVCDKCDYNTAHLACLSMKRVPKGVWHCYQCEEQIRAKKTKPQVKRRRRRRFKPKKYDENGNVIKRKKRRYRRKKKVQSRRRLLADDSESDSIDEGAEEADFDPLECC